MYREYMYRCRRCGDVFTEMGLDGGSDEVEELLGLITTPDEIEERAYKQSYPDGWLRETLLLCKHNCEDGGLGIGDIAGATQPIKETV